MLVIAVDPELQSSTGQLPNDQQPGEGSGATVRYPESRKLRLPRSESLKRVNRGRHFLNPPEIQVHDA